ncbi:MAG: 5-bromo-4-chloroindolyl phosphate hydrolysis family protein, partial [Oscillospiraceae bacterium]|nr:5-bromo-4-chloroindolyl phosphate hydrolysis family protein [Oscillospiraceae bacterium]
YKLWHFIILACVSVLAYLLFSKLFPPKIEYIEVPEEPVTTGDEKIDALLREGEAAVAEINRLGASIKDEHIKIKVRKISELTDKIFKDILEDPDDYRQIRRFADYCLPTTLKLLNSYDRMAGIGTAGENVTGTMNRIDEVLDTTIKAYEKQLDALFANQALDIDTDITVLEALLKKEGLSGPDFDIK